MAHPGCFTARCHVKPSTVCQDALKRRLSGQNRVKPGLLQRQRLREELDARSDLSQDGGPCGPTLLGVADAYPSA